MRLKSVFQPHRSLLHVFTQPGSEAEAPDANSFSSYTEEEFHRALDRFERTRDLAVPAPEIFVFFKHVGGDIARARELWTQARDLFAKIGMPHMVKMVQGWLDGLPPG